MKQSLTGTISYIKIIQAENPTLAYVRIETKSQETISALISKHTLNFIYDVQVGDTIQVYGHFNQRQQFIIEKYLSTHKLKNHQLNLPNHLSYPHRKD